MKKQILMVRDPEQEVGFKVLTDYCEIIQEKLGANVQVIPMWPHGEMELIGDKRKMQLIKKQLREVLEEIEKMEAEADGEQ